MTKLKIRQIIKGVCDETFINKLINQTGRKRRKGLKLSLSTFSEVPYGRNR